MLHEWVHGEYTFDGVTTHTFTTQNSHEVVNVVRLTIKGASNWTLRHTVLTDCHSVQNVSYIVQPSTWYDQLTNILFTV